MTCSPNILRKRLLSANCLYPIFLLLNLPRLCHQVLLQSQSCSYLVPAPLHMVSDIDVTMVIPAALAPVTGDPCQNHGLDISDPCIELLVHLLSADQVPKMFPSTGFYRPQLCMMVQSTNQVPLARNSQATLQLLTRLKPSNQVPMASNSQVTFKLLARLRFNNQVLLAGNAQETFQLPNDGIPADNVPIDGILDCCTYAAHQDLMGPWLPTPLPENVDASKLPVPHAMLKSTKCKGPVSPTVT